MGLYRLNPIIVGFNPENSCIFLLLQKNIITGSYLRPCGCRTTGNFFLIFSRPTFYLEELMNIPV